MALGQDGRDIMETFTLLNLGNLTQPVPFLLLPAGLADYYTAQIRNNVQQNIGLRPDVDQLVKSLIITDQVLVIPT